MTNDDTTRYTKGLQVIDSNTGVNSGGDDIVFTFELLVGKIPKQNVHPGTIQYLVISKETFGLTGATYNAKIKINSNTKEDLYKWITFAPLQRKFDFHATVQELNEAKEKKAKQPPESSIITIAVECWN